MKDWPAARAALTLLSMAAGMSCGLLIASMRRRLRMLEARQRRMMSDLLRLQRPPERYVHPYFESGDWPAYSDENTLNLAEHRAQRSAYRKDRN